MDLFLAQKSFVLRPVNTDCGVCVDSERSRPTMGESVCSSDELLSTMDRNGRALPSAYTVRCRLHRTSLFLFLVLTWLKKYPLIKKA